ncbi:hypothetical protein MIND_00804700 [Mycena indigotica]|uniref:Uncharacterized protein n=1 Tax=Mycena indigotica TaxID=2126181 RepID=A0A8H6SFE5_9AGAR|nr:uncharacterized protein MIND_00804700 [Mycena indigotica]KAF7298580.1 hypothetical protein MIND_00804700 [Mycena indigotica]
MSTDVRLIHSPPIPANFPAIGAFRAPLLPAPIVAHTNHRLALTRLLCGSFHFRGLHSDPASHDPASVTCRKCGEDLETPGHVFLQCRARDVVELRVELREELRQRFGATLASEPTSQAEAERQLRVLIFAWETVVPMARFVYRVCKAWSWFGRKLPSMASELAPLSDDEQSDDEGTSSEGENSVGERGD